MYALYSAQLVLLTKLDLASSPILAFSVSLSKRDQEALSWFVDDAVVKRLLTVPGVGKVNRVGGVSREISVTLDPVKLEGLGVTATDVSRQLRNVQQESAGGRAYLAQGERPVRTLVKAVSSEEIRNIQQYALYSFRFRIAGFGRRDLGGHSLKRGALTTGMDRGVHPAKLKRLGRHKSFDVLGEYLEFGDLFDGHPLTGVL